MYAPQIPKKPELELTSFRGQGYNGHTLPAISKEQFWFCLFTYVLLSKPLSHLFSLWFVIQKYQKGGREINSVSSLNFKVLKSFILQEFATATNLKMPCCNYKNLSTNAP